MKLVDSWTSPCHDVKGFPHPQRVPGISGTFIGSFAPRSARWPLPRSTWERRAGPDRHHFLCHLRSIMPSSSESGHSEERSDRKCAFCCRSEGGATCFKDCFSPALHVKWNGSLPCQTRRKLRWPVFLPQLSLPVVFHRDLGPWSASDTQSASRNHIQ